MDRDRFLAQLAEARAATVLPGNHEPPVVFEWRGRSAFDLSNRFSIRLESVDGIAHRITNPEHGTEELFRLLADYAARHVLMWDPERLPLSVPIARLRTLGISHADPVIPPDAEERTSHQLRLGQATVGITGACAGLAESGTIVLESGPGRPRLASLVPEVHIALLRTADLYDTLYHYLREGPVDLADQANVVLITGPSRTADIELTLTLGAHGPRHLHVLLLDY